MTRRRRRELLIYGCPPFYESGGEGGKERRSGLWRGATRSDTILALYGDNMTRAKGHERVRVLTSEQASPPSSLCQEHSRGRAGHESDGAGANTACDACEHRQGNPKSSLSLGR